MIMCIIRGSSTKNRIFNFKVNIKIKTKNLSLAKGEKISNSVSQNPKIISTITLILRMQKIAKCKLAFDWVNSGNHQS